MYNKFYSLKNKQKHHLLMRIIGYISSKILGNICKITINYQIEDLSELRSNIHFKVINSLNICESTDYLETI